MWRTEFADSGRPLAAPQVSSSPYQASSWFARGSTTLTCPSLGTTRRSISRRYSRATAGARFGELYVHHLSHNSPTVPKVSRALPQPRDRTDINININIDAT